MNTMLLKITALALSIITTTTTSIDIMNSVIVSPRTNSLTPTPVIVGVMLNNNRRPIKKKAVTIIIDDRPVATVETNKNGVWSYELTHGLADGCHLAQAYVQISPNNKAWGKSALFEVNATALTSTYRSGNVDPANSFINFPFEGSHINTTTPIVIGTLLDSGYNPVSGETVTIKIDASTVGNPTSDSNGVFSYELSTGLSEATHTADAHCVQSSQDLTTTNFTVDVTAPAAPTIVAPTQNSTVTTSLITITGTSEPLATITTFMDDDTYGDINYADENGDWSAEYELDNDIHWVTAQAHDLANNTSTLSAERDFTVNA